MTKKSDKLQKGSKKIAKIPKKKSKVKAKKATEQPEEVVEEEFEDVGEIEDEQLSQSEQLEIEEEIDDEIEEEVEQGFDEIQEDDEQDEGALSELLAKNLYSIDAFTHLIFLEEQDHVMIGANYKLKVLAGSTSSLGWKLDRRSKIADVKSRGKAQIPLAAIEVDSINKEVWSSTLEFVKNYEECKVNGETEKELKKFFENRWDSALLFVHTDQSLNLGTVRMAKGKANFEDENPNAIVYPDNIDGQIDANIFQNLQLSNLRQKVLIIGDKNSGKSLFSVYVMNYLLSNLQKSIQNSTVFYLESDLGQNSFFVPGTVGLFNFTSPVLNNLTQPILQKPITYDFIGEYSPQQFVYQYIKAVENCIKFYDYSSLNCPLIVNTHGYIANIGENIIYDLVKIVQPDVVILLDKYSQKVSNVDYGYLEYNPLNKIEENLRKKTFAKHISIFGLPQKMDQKTPSVWKLVLPKFKEAITHKKEKKDSTMLKYLTNNHEMNGAEKITRISELSLLNPVELSFEEYMFAVLGNTRNLFFFREHFTKFSMIFISSIVSLNYSPLLNTREKTYHQSLDYQHAFKNSSSKGFGFVRDINVEKRTILVITPLSAQELGMVNVIFKSSQVQFSNDTYLDDSITNSENWLGLPNYNSEGQPSRANKLFINDVLYGVGSESYRNLKSMRKIQ